MTIYHKFIDHTTYVFCIHFSNDYIVGILNTLFMKIYLTIITLALACIVCIGQQIEFFVKGDTVIQRTENYVVMEAELTSSSYGHWEEITSSDDRFVSGASNNKHIEFTSNGINGGAAKSPLKYTFKINNAGDYRLLIRASKRLDGADSDKCNDGYIKMEGDFDAPSTTNVHNSPATETQLRSQNKFFGGWNSSWGWAQQIDLGGHNNKRNAIYSFSKGEYYTLTVWGRSIRWNIDKIILYRTNNYSLAQAKNNAVAWKMSDAPLSTNTVINTSEIVAYPNPFSNQIFFDGSQKPLQFYSLTGQSVNLEFQKTSNGYVVQTTHLAKGIYFLHFDDAIIKLIKE